MRLQSHPPYSALSSPLLSSPPGRSWSPQEFPAQWGPRRDGIFNKRRAEDAEEQRWACLPGRAGKDTAAEPQPLLCSPRGAQRSPSRLQPLLLPHRCVTDSMGRPHMISKMGSWKLRL